MEKRRKQQSDDDKKPNFLYYLTQSYECLLLYVNILCYSTTFFLTADDCKFILFKIPGIILCQNMEVVSNGCSTDHTNDAVTYIKCIILM
jgi:hypothetical protein